MLRNQAAIYILTNKYNGALYTGVTNNLIKRVYEHKQEIIMGFTKKYHCHRLVYYELFDSIINAISREKQIKASSRKKKILLIEGMNATWKDLYDSLF